MRKLLTIGEAARLVGTTPKAVRNYHRVGLLPEPGRSEAGYRLYSASDLMKMRHVRRLQDLGLSLKRIREVLLGEPEGEPSLRSVLEALLSEVYARIEELEGRKRRIEGLLAREDLDDDFAEPPAPSPTFERFKETFARHLSKIDPEVLEQEEKLWAVIDAFEWPEEHVEAREAMVRHYAQRSGRYREFLALEEQILALAKEPEDSPKVERLARKMARLQRENPPPGELLEATGQMEGPMGRVFSELILAHFSPAQRRFVELVREFSGEGEGLRGEER